MTVEPRLEREPVDRPRTRGRAVRGEVGEHTLDRLRERVGLGGSSRSKPSGCGTPMPASSPTSSRHAAAPRIDDGHAARHRLEHDARARVVHLRVQEDLGPAEERGRVGLRVAAERMHPPPQTRAARERLHRDDEPAGDEQPGIGV